MNKFTIFFTFLFIACFNLSSRAANNVENPNTMESIENISRGLLIVGELDPTDSSRLIYKMVNNSNHMLYINLQSLNKPLIDADITRPDISGKGIRESHAGSPISGYSHSISVEQVNLINGNIITLEPNKYYIFNYIVDKLFSSISLPGENLAEEKNVTYTFQLQFDHLVTGFDKIKNNKEIFKASFLSKPLTVKK